MALHDEEPDLETQNRTFFIHKHHLNGDSAEACPGSEVQPAAGAGCLFFFFYPGGKIPSTVWVEQPISSSGKEEKRQTKTAPVHSLLAPLTERFNLRITTPPSTVPRTASGMQIPPGDT